MAQAPRYVRQKDFQDDNPDWTNHAQLNNEFDQVSESVNTVIDNLALIQADDGGLESGAVTPRSLSDEVLALMTGTNVLTIEGPPGPAGQSFQPTVFDLAAERSTYDAEVKGFSFMAMDTGELFFKLSDAVGDWSIGHPFGKGDKGDKGDAGDPGANAIVASVDGTTVPIDIIGKSSLFVTLVVDGDGKLAISLSTGD